MKNNTYVDQYNDVADKTAKNEEAITKIIKDIEAIRIEHIEPLEEQIKNAKIIFGYNNLYNSLDDAKSNRNRFEDDCIEIIIKMISSHILDKLKTPFANYKALLSSDKHIIYHINNIDSKDELIEFLNYIIDNSHTIYLTDYKYYDDGGDIPNGRAIVRSKDNMKGQKFTFNGIIYKKGDEGKMSFIDTLAKYLNNI